MKLQRLQFISRTLELVLLFYKEQHTCMEYSYRSGPTLYTQFFFSFFFSYTQKVIKFFYEIFYERPEHLEDLVEF